MKIFKTFQNFSLFLLLFTLFCCNSQKKNIKVSQAYYRTFITTNEKGYDLFFSVNRVDAIPKYIIINSIKQNIFPDNQVKIKKYHFRVLSESRLIDNYRAEIRKKQNGIGFMLDSEEVFVPVKFQIRK
ncbi:hypothetical protein AAH994_01225 [Weeksellaceae bacterium A-14]